ncbi:MAG: hypothetical protein HY084_05590 [Gemmatimonadetes bacterium]|nr:hypothetical protein [Gemmatimonadota bacterium]
MPSPIAGSVLPLQRAEELIGSLAGVVSARIVASENGTVEAIHVLVQGETQPKQMVRNIESALMADLGMRVDHRKVSVATTTRRSGEVAVTPPPQPSAAVPAPVGVAAAMQERQVTVEPAEASGRALYFEDVEVRGSRVKGVTCKVTLRRGSEQYVGEAEGQEAGDKARVELAASAAVHAIVLAEGNGRTLSLEGAKVISAFDRELVLVAVVARSGRQAQFLTGCCEMKDNSETASALAVLNATNRWVEGVK